MSSSRDLPRILPSTRTPTSQSANQGGAEASGSNSRWSSTSWSAAATAPSTSSARPGSTSATSGMAEQSSRSRSRWDPASPVDAPASSFASGAAAPFATNATRKSGSPPPHHIQERMPNGVASYSISISSFPQVLASAPIPTVTAVGRASRFSAVTVPSSSSSPSSSSLGPRTSTLNSLSTSTESSRYPPHPTSLPPAVPPAPLSSTARASRFKPTGTRDYRVLYDPVCDSSVVKKGKEIVYRYDGDGIAEGGVVDPRSRASTTNGGGRGKERGGSAKRRKLNRLSYNWDKNSTTAAPAPPPCAVLITGFPGSTTSDQLHRHFATYGRIELLEVKVDPATGGSLGVCWCRFFDEFPRDGHPSTSSSASGTTSIGRTGGEGAMSRSAQMESYKRELKKGLAQDGNQVALNAISTGNGQRIGTRMMMTSAGVSVVMDGEGKLCKAAVQDELEKKKKKLSETNELEKKKRMDASVNAAPTTASVSGSTPLTPVSMSSAAAPRSTYNDLHAASSSQSLYRPTTSTFAAPGPPSNHQHASHSHAYGARTAISISTRQVPSHPQSYPFPASGASDRFAPSIAPSGSRSMRPISEASAPTLQHPSVHSASLPPRPRRNVISPNRRVLAPHSPTNLTSSSHRNVNGSSTGGSQPTSMKLAVAAAVEQAKKRHEQEKLKERRDAADNVDMDLGSSHDGDSSDGDGEEEEEQVFFHHYRSGPPSRGGPSAASHLPLKPTLASAASMEWQASSVALREKLVLNGNAYLAISKKDFYAARTTRDDTYAPAPLSTSDLARFFGKHPMAQMLVDQQGWYITFTSTSLAGAAHAALHKRPFAGAPLSLAYCEPRSTPPFTLSPTQSHPEGSSAASRQFSLPYRAPSRSPTTSRAAIPARKAKVSGWTDAELLQEAEEMVIHDLMEAFQSDLRTRVVSTKVWEGIARLEKIEEAKAASAPPRHSPHLAHQKQHYTSSIGSAASALSNGTKAARALAAIPLRRPSSTTPSSTIDSRVSSTEVRSDSGRSTPTQLDDETGEESTQPAGHPMRTKEPPVIARKDKTTLATSSTSKVNTKVTSKSQVQRPSKQRAYYTSSEDEEDDRKDKKSARATASASASTIIPAIPLSNTVDEIPPTTTKVAARVAKKAKVEKASTKKTTQGIAVASPDAIKVEMDIDDANLDEGTSLPTPTATDAIDSDRDDDLDDLPSTSINAKGAKGGAKQLRSAAVYRARGPTPDPIDAGIAADEEDLFYIKLAIERPRRGLSLHPDEPFDDELNENIPAVTVRHPTGAARTEGFYIITGAEKMANRPSANSRTVIVAPAAASGVAVSRLARVNTRGLVRGMELHKKVTATDGDVLKFNQLRTRKKQLSFSRSGIHDYGLFAMEHIPQGEMVIEYVGELVRQQVADRREKAYERQGIGSSYLFRVDDDLVVDATKKGNLGRLINHCCVPNCNARIITINGEKKIVIYAKTNIEAGDEVTYDYHFPHEEVKIPCLCMHPLCRKYLN